MNDEFQVFALKMHPLSIFDKNMTFNELHYSSFIIHHSIPPQYFRLILQIRHLHASDFNQKSFVMNDTGHLFIIYHS